LEKLGEDVCAWCGYGAFDEFSGEAWGGVFGGCGEMDEGLEGS
jgi:hypothetical protein